MARGGPNYPRLHDGKGDTACHCCGDMYNFPQRHDDRLSRAEEVLCLECRAGVRQEQVIG